MELIGTISGWLYYGLVVVLLVTAMLRKQEPASSLAWSLAIVFLPVFGPLAFLLFGIPRMPRRLKQRIAHAESFVTHAPASFASDGAEVRRSAGRDPLAETLQELGAAPRRTGNSVILYRDGKLTLEDMLVAIAAARDHIHVEYYIFRLDRMGRALVDALAAKARDGVEVRVLVDAVGTFRGFRLLRELRAAGVKAESFNPLVKRGRFISPNLRNHRKIIVCDGRVAFFGGLNVGVEYLGKTGRYGRDWTDFHLRLEGPSSWDLQEVFAQDWDYATGEDVRGERYFPAISTPPGGSAVQIVAGGPDIAVNPIREAVLLGLARAERHIRIATPYVVPDAALRDLLMSAARAGVAVDIVTQGVPPDRWITHFCGLYFTRELLAAGVRVHHYRQGMMHSKALAFDERWALAGTANLDNRSMILNFEVMAVLDGPAEVRAVAEELDRLIAESAPVSLDALRDAPWPQKAAASLAHLAAPLL